MWVSDKCMCFTSTLLSRQSKVRGSQTPKYTCIQCAHTHTFRFISLSSPATVTAQVATESEKMFAGKYNKSSHKRHERIAHSTFARIHQQTVHLVALNAFKCTSVLAHRTLNGNRALCAVYRNQFYGKIIASTSNPTFVCSSIITSPDMSVLMGGHWAFCAIATINNNE